MTWAARLDCHKKNPGRGRTQRAVVLPRARARRFDRRAGRGTFAHMHGVVMGEGEVRVGGGRFRAFTGVTPGPRTAPRIVSGASASALCLVSSLRGRPGGSSEMSVFKD